MNNFKKNPGLLAPPEEPGSIIEAFLFCPKLGPTKKHENHTEVFSRLSKLDEQLDECLVFLTSSSAIQYSQFMNTDHVVLRAYVHHAAIEGVDYGLRLRKGFLAQHHVHGYFPGWAKGSLYIENPAFNENLAGASPR